MLERASNVFEGGNASLAPGGAVKTLQGKIGELPSEKVFYEPGSPNGRAKRKNMIDRAHPLSAATQAKALGVSEAMYITKPSPSLSEIRPIDWFACSAAACYRAFYWITCDTKAPRPTLDAPYEAGIPASDDSNLAVAFLAQKSIPTCYLTCG